LTVDPLSERVGEMSEAAAHVPSERLSWQEICVRHVGEWVLLVDVDWIDDVDFEPRSAVLVAHSTNRRETRGRVKMLPENIEFAHFFISKPGHRE
jgi:hypothetical protein